MIQEAILKATGIPTENSRASKGKTESNDLTLATTFNPDNEHLFPLIQRAFNSF